MENKTALQEQVVDFFLTIYKYQVGVPETENADFVLVDPDAPGPNYTYELRVKKSGQMKSRRMAITMIGDGSGSKSKCFKVIYDDVLVVKIPPQPLKKFKLYLKAVNDERKIAAKLNPQVEFVAPGVSAIFKKINTFEDTANLKPLQLEKKYLKWLVENKDMLEYLKINGNYTFIMDLSKHAFLSYFVDEMHDQKVFNKKIKNDITGSTGILTDFLQFEEKYGPENADTGYNISNIYGKYGNDIKVLATQHNISISQYEIQEWFLLNLAEEEIPAKDEQSADFFSELNMLFRKTNKDNHHDFDAYRQIVKSQIKFTDFSQNKTKMEGIITNLLDLLAILQQKKLSIRDLKPDNMFVVGDIESNPFFLAAPEEYSLGLIDFETAVLFSKPNNQEVAQPLQAGTPAYATPSHLFDNKTLKKNLGELARTFYLQDWHAVVAMIYNIVLGTHLFKKTRDLLPKIIRLKNKKPGLVNDIFKRGSQVFWKQADNEFIDRTGTKEKLIINSIVFTVPDNAREMLQREIRNVILTLADEIRDLVMEQDIFTGDKARDNLKRSSYEEVKKYKDKWKCGIDVPDKPPETRLEIIKLLNNLEKLKGIAKLFKHAMKKLQKSDVKMTAFELIEIMFNIVWHHMYSDDWMQPSKISEDDFYGGDDDTHEDATIVADL